MEQMVRLLYRCSVPGGNTRNATGFLYTMCIHLDFLDFLSHPALPAEHRRVLTAFFASSV